MSPNANNKRLATAGRERRRYEVCFGGSGDFSFGFNFFALLKRFYREVLFRSCRRAKHMPSLEETAPTKEAEPEFSGPASFFVWALSELCFTDFMRTVICQWILASL